MADIETTLLTPSPSRAAIAAGRPHAPRRKVALQARSMLALQLKATGKTLEARHKQWLKLLDTAEKPCAPSPKTFDSKAAREAKRAALLAADAKERSPTVRDAVLDALKQAAYFIHQVPLAAQPLSQRRV